MLENKNLESLLHTSAEDLFFYQEPASHFETAQENEVPLWTEALRETHGRTNLLPIESLKDDADFWLNRLQNKKNLKRVFLSSGTTLRDRSRSPFSEHGLMLYRKFSLKAFWSVLSFFFKEPKKTLGWSMIPNLKAWPDSSLAQMVEWIAEEGCVYYGSEPPPFSKEGPIYVFATAFHIVKWADSGHKLQLPPGSIVVETGGTKGQSRSVSRAELYSLIESCLGIPSNFVVSEYGMCELASQAYDFIAPSHTKKIDLDQRYFCFPSWVKVSVMNNQGTLSEAGLGTLCINDPLRIDLPWILRTEDVANISENGKFQLIGRVPFSPLKGCSLLAEDIQLEDEILNNNISKVNTSKPELQQIQTRAEKIAKEFHTFIEDPVFITLLTHSLGFQQLTNWCLEDLKNSAPTSATQWARAALKAAGAGTVEKWLFILPSTHPVAGIYPILFAGILNLKIQVRAPIGTEIFQYIKTKLFPDLEMNFLDRNFKLGIHSKLKIEAIMAFGSDETILSLKKRSSWPMKCFGTCLTASLLGKDELGSYATRVWRDALSLGQLGCLSSRVLFILGGNRSDFAELGSTLMHAYKTAFSETRSSTEQLSLIHASYQWRRLGKVVFKGPNPGDPVIIPMEWDPNLTLDRCIVDRPWALPMILIPEEKQNAWIAWCNRQRQLKKISCSEKLLHLSATLNPIVTKLGLSNSPTWDGQHFGESLFSLGTSAEL